MTYERKVLLSDNPYNLMVVHARVNVNNAGAHAHFEIVNGADHIAVSEYFRDDYPTDPKKDFDSLTVIGRLIEVLTEFKSALTMAREEVVTRPQPKSFSLLDRFINDEGPMGL